MAGRARCWTAQVVLVVLVTAARCSAGQQPQPTAGHAVDQPQQQEQNHQHSGDPLEQLLALVSRAVTAAANPIVAELRSQRTLLDGIVSQLEVQDTRLDALKAGQDALDGRLVHQNASLDLLKVSLDAINGRLDALNARVNISVAAALHAPPRDCSELPTGARTGVYTLRLGRGVGRLADASAFCDMNTTGGGWTVFQRRADLLPRQNFFLEWADYRNGFGNMTGEFWWGLEKLHLLTSPRDRRYELRVELEDFDGNRKHALYQGFAISSEKDGYRLTASKYSGDAGDSLSHHFGKKFSTKDRDQDTTSFWHCAQKHKGAWWYGNCRHSSLNGEYLSGRTSDDTYGIIWYDWKGYDYSLKTVEMKVRPTAHV